jgi:hypothetical protein
MMAPMMEAKIMRRAIIASTRLMPSSLQSSVCVKVRSTPEKE